MSLVILEREYDGNSIIDASNDVFESLEYGDLEIPREDGFWKGRFKLTLTWEPE